MRRINLLLTLSLVVLLSACGQKGELHLPDEEPQTTNESQSTQQ